jgi:orotidine-5'-phosphate decarboxylase
VEETMFPMFLAKLDFFWNQNKHVCVGLDVDTDKFPDSHRTGIADMYRFNCEIVDATHDIVAAYKPNLWFYLRYGSKGLSMLEDTVRYIRAKAPQVIVILDAKFNDIGDTTKAQAAFAFDALKVDAVTANPYMGKEAATPLLERKEGVFWLARTSNPGAGEFQDLRIEADPDSESRALYEHVAASISLGWNNLSQNCGLVVGATTPDELSRVRKIAPDIPFLLPGFGKQGAPLEPAVRAAKNRRGGFIANNGSALIYASKDADFAKEARAKTLEFDQQIRHALIS